ncbi:FHAD1 protein, partial [Machaerirhynchus nigripectus]|nr:FHAD1 protein [Machaerirhynchus nigripectus]
QDGQLRAAQEENELQRQKLHKEVAGYREQSKQHSLTILALEDRLLEAAQQQKMLEEEKAALVGKMEGLWPIPQHRVTPGDQKAGFALIFPRKLQEELAVARGMLLEKTAVISRLTRELSETRARMSDMRGELSEEQKVELEHSQRQLKHREWEVNQLREKLSKMSNLVEEKDRALKAAAEELRYTLTSPEASQMPLCMCPVPGSKAVFTLSLCCSRCRLGKNQSSACFFQEPPSGLAELGAKCRGLRHEETIQRQKEGLAELRERVKMLEKRQCSGGAVKDYSEPLVVQMKDLAEKIVQQRGLEMEPAPGLGGKLKAGKVPDHIPNGGSFRITNSTASLEMAEATDFGEKMYLEVISALGSLVEMKELSGMQPLQHLPREKRAEMGLQRQKALELLYKKIRNLQIRLERREEMLKGYEGSVEQLRQNQASLHHLQEEMSNLEDEAHREAEEKALLREALQRTQLQLDQEKSLRRVAKRHKV